MKKSDAVKIEKAFLKLHCPHNEWKYAGIFVYGSFRSTIVECKECGKKKNLCDLRENEVLD